MPQPGPAPQLIRFGIYEVDVRSGELRKSGVKIKLQEQPFQVLWMLLQRPGELVTREELRAQLWPNGTFVDFEHGLNNSILKLREALCDEANNPRFIQTLHRRGYKFICPLDGNGLGNKNVIAMRDVTGQDSALSPYSNEEDNNDNNRIEKNGRSRGLITIAIVTAFLSTAVGAWWFWPMPMPRVLATRQLTFGARSGGPAPFGGDFFPAVVTDGSRIYFSGFRKGGSLQVGYASVAGGEAVFPQIPLASSEVRHISPDGTVLLIYGPAEGEAEQHLWFLPTAGGGPRRFPDSRAHDGAWSPDGRTLIYASGQELYTARADGEDPHKLLGIPGRAFWIRWSPDGSRVRFTLVDLKTNSHTLWECTRYGGDLHRLPLIWESQPQECCGQWTPDSKYFVFRMFREGRADIWVVREKKGHNSLKPLGLTYGPFHFFSASLSTDGKKIFSAGGEVGGEDLIYDPKTRSTGDILPGFGIYMEDLTKDGDRVVYVEQRGKNVALWRSKRDGSERLQLTTPPMLVTNPIRWSPDAKQIVFSGQASFDKLWSIYVVSANGGPARDLLTDGRHAFDPSWSPDGRLVMFGRPPDRWFEGGMYRWLDRGMPKSIHTVDVQTGAVTTLPGSEGLFSPRWSPDGHYVAAMPFDRKKIVLFDVSTQKWTDLAIFEADNPQWSPDGEYVYFQSQHHVVWRVRRKDRKLERVVDLSTVNPNAVGCDLHFVLPDGKLSISCGAPRFDLYALDLDLP